MIKRDNCHTFFNCKNCKCKGSLRIFNLNFIESEIFFELIVKKHIFVSEY